MTRVPVFLVFIQPDTGIKVIMKVTVVTSRINIGTVTVIVDSDPSVVVHCVYL